MIVWYEPHRITHAEAAAKTRYTRHPAVTEFAREVAEHVTGGDRASHVRLTVKDRAVARIRYTAGKHRLVCYEPERRAVLNPPLMRRAGAWELSSCLGHSIDDPDPSHIADAVRALDADNWFVALEAADDHYVQAALISGRYVIEVRDGDAAHHFQAPVDDPARITAAFQAQAAGDTSWRDGFTWRPVSS